MLTLHLGGDFGVLDWKFQNFWNFFIGREKWTTVFCVAETEVLHYLLLLYRKVAKGKVENILRDVTGRSCWQENVFRRR
jgi:hypothetical protein